MSKRVGIVALIIGIFIIIIGVALIIISPILFDTSGRLITEADAQPFEVLKGLGLFSGIALLIVGGIISAVGGIIATVGSGIKGVGPVRQQQLDGVFLSRDGQRSGPYQIEAIMEWHKSGKLNENDMVFDKRSNQWIPAVTFLGVNDPIITSPASNTSSLDELEKLASLREKGIISEAEYEKKKGQILGI